MLSCPVLGNYTKSLPAVAAALRNPAGGFLSGGKTRKPTVEEGTSYNPHVKKKVKDEKGLIYSADRIRTGPSRPDSMSGVSLVRLRMLVRVKRFFGGRN